MQGNRTARRLTHGSVIAIVFLLSRSFFVRERIATILTTFQTTDKVPPTAKAYENPHKAAICVVVKSEEFYLEEWIDYNLDVLGFDHIFMFDNTDDHEMEHFIPLLSPSRRQKITLIPYPGYNVQRTVYWTCGRDYVSSEYTYAAFFDVDEFLVLRKHDKVHDFLEEYVGHDPDANVGAISLYWLTMGSDHQITYQPFPVSYRFQYTHADINPESKTVSRIDAMDINQEPHPHYFYLKQGHIRVNTAGRALWRYVTPNPPQGDVAVLFHYKSKSHKEYIMKRQRGQVDVLTSITWQIEDAKAGRGFENGTVYDDTVWQKLIQARPQYRMFENYAVPAPRYEPSFNKRSFFFSTTTTSSIMAASAVLCATTQNEEAYLDEWVDYHLALGFTEIVLYDTTETFELRKWGAEKHDKVQVYPFYNHTEEEARDHCHQRMLDTGADHHDHDEAAATPSLSSSSWVAYWEVGSMLILRQHTNVLDFITKHATSSSATPTSSIMVIKRQVFQVSDQQVYRPRPFTYRFRYVRTDVDDHHVRTIEQQPLNGNDFSSSSPVIPLTTVVPTKEAVLFVYPLRAAKEYVQRFGGSLEDATLNSGLFSESVRDENGGANEVTYTKEGWETLKKYIPWYAEYEKL